MVVSYTCPYCGFDSTASDDEAGRTVSCRSCGAPVAVSEAGSFNPYQSPQTTWTPEAGTGELERGWGWVLFLFDGRIPRRTWWLATIFKNIVIYGILFVFIVLGETGTFDFQGSSQVVSALLVVFFVVFGISWFWITLAVTCKRFHDRDKSGWWYLVTCIPYIGPLWLFIECGCLRGTYGMNTYGPDPT